MDALLREEGEGADCAPGGYGGGKIEGDPEGRHERDKRIDNEGAYQDLPHEVRSRVGATSYSLRRTV